MTQPNFRGLFKRTVASPGVGVGAMVFFQPPALTHTRFFHVLSMIPEHLLTIFAPWWRW